VIRASPSNSASISDPSPALTVLQVVNRIMASSTDTLLGKTKACFILRAYNFRSNSLIILHVLLDYLVTDDTELCRTAYEQGSLEKAVALAIAITPLEERTEWDKDEPESISNLRAVILGLARFESVR
jgi:armadillo repeat-containing protein 8